MGGATLGWRTQLLVRDCQRRGAAAFNARVGCVDARAGTLRDVLRCWGSQSVRNIKTNDQVVVTTTNSVECVSLEGRAVLVEGDEAEPLAVGWAEKYCDDNFSKEDMMEAVYGGAAFEVIPERAFGMIETPEEFSKCATRWLWD